MFRRPPSSTLFPSPPLSRSIRRYADLVVHRALIRGLGLGEGALPETETVETLTEVAAQISVTERRAMKAERETADRLIAHRSEEHTSELQSHLNLVCRLLLE